MAPIMLLKVYPPTTVALLLLLCFSLLSFHYANSQSFIGVNYGQVADNLPPPEATAKLLKSTSIEKVRLYGADPAIIKALANTGIASLGGKIKVSTVHSMAVLSQSDPPSSGAFGYGDTMKALLQFHSANGSPFMINPYPFFAYQSDPRPDTLAFCLFQPNAGRVDSGSGIKYMNMFDAQVDAVHSALKGMGFKDVEIVVAETGWPYKGDANEVGPSLDSAKAYNGNLINHLRSMVGTPLMPGKSVDTYLFALYDEDLKPGPGSERSFGLFKPDLSMTYDVGLSKSTQTPAPTPATPAPAPATPAPTTPVNPAPTTPGSSPSSNNSHNSGGEPSTKPHSRRNPWNCDFLQTASITTTNPSYNACVYPGGNT
ncbi:UNVERIFIED_CONTAM: Glucan endo-1,3-beta-D-glucosidase [Sesamum angustifolium]|uniref:Glucan endo-1,3-beta-D-glucosidase n=1 Tax=Sesamum angustifolium TaxID=2727405 RepID=A0AAW2QCC6_9LAMI